LVYSGIPALSLSGRERPRLRTFLALLPFVTGLAATEAASATTIFGTSPGTEFVGDPTNYELGTYFESSVAGQVTALRVWVGSTEAGNPGTIVGNLWDANGDLLESATFSNIVKGGGWNEVTLASPVSITPNTIYVVSANTNAGSTGLGAYAGLADFFSGGSYSNPPLTALSGDFGAPGTFPTQTYRNNNYFRDVEFSPVPEASNALLLSLGIVGLAIQGHRRRPVNR
jgi:hypothetical protein